MQPADPEGAALTSYRRFSVYVLLRNIGIFFVGLGLVCSAIRSQLPFPEVPGIYPKVRFFLEHAGEYDAVFFGSSRLYHHVIPKRFDSAVAEISGRKLRSFNLSYDALWLPESLYVLQHVLAKKPQKLKWVFIDLMEVNPNIDETNRGSMRAMYWHDLHCTRMALDALALAKMAEPMRAELRLEHITLFVRRWLNHGRGAHSVAELFAPSKKRKRASAPDWAQDEGFLAGPEETLQGKEKAGFESTVARLKAGRAPSPITPTLRKALGEMISLIRSSGAEPVLVLGQTLSERENFTELPPNVAVIRFDDPHSAPKLYDPEYHYDGWHFNRRGAEIFTDLLALRAAELWKGKP